MFTLLDYAYDLIYFVIKNIEDFSLQPLVIYIVYLWGKRSGMKRFRKFITAHFKNWEDEESQWRNYVTKQLIKLGADAFIPPKQYRGVTRQSRYFQRNLTKSLTLLPEGKDQEGNNMKIVVLDAGHGGKDTGAIGFTKKKEKDFNLSIVLKVESLLLNHPQVSVKLTRSTDVFIELLERANIANRLKADAFVSIHANSAGLASTSGTETLYTRTDSKDFAELMHALILPITGGKDRKAKYQNLSVCRNTKMPAILLEPEFMSNPQAEALIFDPTFQDTFAETIAKGICQFLKVEYISTESTAPSAPIIKPLPTGIAPLSVIANAQVYTGYLQNGISWVPAKPILNYLNNMWTFVDKHIVLEGKKLETTIIENNSYIKAKDLLSIGARIYFDNDAAPKRLDIFRKLEG